MTDPRLEDHVVGLELQLVELVERHKQAQTLVGGEDEVARLEAEIADLQSELAASAERLVADEPPEAGPGSDINVTDPLAAGAAEPVQPTTPASF